MTYTTDQFSAVHRVNCTHVFVISAMVECIWNFVASLCVSTEKYMMLKARHNITTYTLNLFGVHSALMCGKETEEKLRTPVYLNSV